MGLGQRRSDDRPYHHNCVAETPNVRRHARLRMRSVRGLVDPADPTDAYQVGTSQVALS